jgi:transaldolase
MAEASVGSRKRSAADGAVLGTGAEELFTFPWPGPGNSEGPVDPDPWSVQPGGESFASGSGYQSGGLTLGRTTVNPLLRLAEGGQSVWLDFLRRGLIRGGGLERLRREDGVSGVTSNPTVFGKAIVGSPDYDEAIRAIAGADGRPPIDTFYDLALADVTMAADAFRAVFEDTGGADGFVSFELEPRLARNARGSIEAARALFQRIGRPNVIIKVPGTEEGVPAVEELTALGVKVNITLLFSVALYEKVALAYIRGLERRLEAGQRVDRMASVASFFVSRVDAAVDGLLAEGSPLRGTVAIANAKLAYHRFRQLFSGKRWDRLARAGARVQRPLWASTGTKDPAYSDVLYVQELVGPDTVTTVPEATLNAFRDHGLVQAGAVMEGLEEAERTLGLLPGHGIDLGVIADRLVAQGLEAFQTDLTELLEVIAGKLGDADRAVVGERNIDRFGSLQRGAVEPLATGR